MPKHTEPEPTWKLYDMWYRRGHALGTQAKERNDDRSTFVLQIYESARVEAVPLCMWTDFRDGCTDGYDGLVRPGSALNQ